MIKKITVKTMQQSDFSEWTDHSSNLMIRNRVPLVSTNMSDMVGSDYDNVAGSYGSWTIVSHAPFV